MALTANLQASFGADGFDLDASISGLAGQLAAVSPVPVSFDGSATDSLSSLLDGISLDDVTALIGPVVEVIQQIVPGFPDIASLLQPIESVTTIMSQGPSGALENLIHAIDGPAEPTPGAAIGLAGLQASIRPVLGLAEDPSVKAVLDLLHPFVGNLNLGAPGALLGGPAGGLVSLIQLLGALMAVESISRDVARLADLVVSMLATDTVQALTARARDTSGLPDLIAGIDPDDPDLVEVVALPIEEYADRLVTLADVLTRGLGFGQATLLHADFTGLAAALEVATLLLSESALPPVRALGATVAGWLDPITRIPLPTASTTIDAVVDQIAVLANPVVEAVNGLQPTMLSNPIHTAIDPVLAPVKAVGQVATEVQVALRSGFQPVRAALDAVDLTSVQAALHTVLGPISQAIEALTTLIGDAQAAIGAGAQAVMSAIGPVRDALTEAADAIGTAFGALEAAVDALGLADLQQTLSQGVDAVAGAIHAAQLKPVFDVATGIIDTGADLLGAVPKALLPDDLKQALDDACAPVEALDLEPVREELRTELQGISAAIDADVLADLKAAFDEVVAFLDSIDPEPLATDFEQSTFDPMVERLLAIDPTVPLAGVIRALDNVKQAVADFDPVAALKPVDDALDSVAQAIQGIDPAALLEPIERKLTELRTWVSDTLQLPQWPDRIKAIDTFIAQITAQLDPVPIVARLDGAWAGVVDGIRGEAQGTSVVGSIIASLMEGVGAPVRADALPEVLAWIRGDRDGAVVVRERLRRAATALDDTHAAVAALDLQALVGELETTHAQVLSAVTGQADGSLLRLRLERTLQRSSPLTLLGSVVDARGEYAGQLGEAAGIVGVLGPSDRGEVRAIADGLGVAAQPLRPALHKPLDLLAGFGVDVSHVTSPRDLLADLLAQLSPARLLQPLVVLLDAIRTKLPSLAHDGVVVPLLDAVTALQQAIDAIDLAPLTTELTDVRDELVAKVDALRPEAILGEVLTAFTDAKAALAAFDPLGPVRAVVDTLQAAITQLSQELRPTTLFQPVIEVHHEVRDAISGLDVAGLLQPVLDALDGIAQQLEEGMDRVIDSLGRLKDACESDGGLLPDLGISVGASVDVGSAAGGLGL